MGLPALSDNPSSAARHERYRGVETAAVYSDIKSEFAALSTGCGLYDLSWRSRLRVSGGDRVRWLNGMITNNVRDLEPDHGIYAFLLNPQGRILADLYAYNAGEFLIIDTDRSQQKTVADIFDRYIIMDDVEVAALDSETTAIGICGPGAGAVLKAFGVEVESLASLSFRNQTFRGINIRVVRGDMPLPAYELWLAPADVNSVWDALVKAGATPVGTQAFELLRIACGIPLFGQDIRERDLPQETEQMRALHFSKGCYVGQEIVERIRSRGAVHRKFTGFVLQDPMPARGTKLRADDKEVGELTSIGVLPLAQKDVPVALGYIRREAGVPGKQLQHGEATATVSPVPFPEFLNAVNGTTDTR